MPRVTRSVLAVLFVAFIVPSASIVGSVRADALPPQAPCPPGATRVSGHFMSYCRPDTCESDAACEGGATCQSAGLCVVSVTTQVASSFPPRPGDTMRDVTYDDARGACSDSSACTDGVDCVTVRRCVGPTPAAPVPPAENTAGSPGSSEAPVAQEREERGEGAAGDDAGSGGCAIGTGHSSTMGSLLLIAMMALAHRRRR